MHASHRESRSVQATTLDHVCALAEQGRILHTLSAGTSAIVWACLPQSGRVYLNPSGRVFAGPLEDFSIRAWLGRIHRADRERFRKTILEAARSAACGEGRFRVRAADGRFHWLAVAAAPWRAADGQIGGIIGTANDVSLTASNGSDRHALRGRLLLAREDERQRIARELHDGVCQRLALLSTNIESLKRATNLPGAVAASLQSLW